MIISLFSIMENLPYLPWKEKENLVLSKFSNSTSLLAEAQRYGHRSPFSRHRDDRGSFPLKVPVYN